MENSTARVVLIGGSAGSLSAIQSLFEALPTECGLSYVVIQHISPKHRSQLHVLISKWTTLPVQQVFAGATLEPNHIYVGLPGFHMTLKGRTVHLQAKTGDEYQHKPIDFFCQTLASQCGAKAALVILSGTGSDGTEGAREIKKAGGVVLIQDSDSASFDGMPLSVMAAGLSEQALAPDEIARSICAWGRSGLTTIVEASHVQRNSDDELFKAILALVRDHSHKDIDGYKPTTLRRRIGRRISLRHAHGLDDYLSILQQNPAELDQLAKDMLIGVTAFFRDAEAFKIIEEQVIAQLCAARPAPEPVRIWIAACSTGEEAYSLAMLFMEWFEAHGQAPRIQIFATDIDSAALDVARAGLYSKEALANVSDARIERFFKEEKNDYRINKAARETIVFASHNLISDPPFSKLDLVVCRNLLIYLNSTVQKKLMSLFHFVLNPGGYLFLGSSESIGSVVRHFESISKQWRIYRHLNTARRRLPVLPISAGTGARRQTHSASTMTSGGTIAGQERLYRQLLETHGLTQVLVNTSYELLYVSGDTAPYLSIPVGQASHDLLKMAKPSLAIALRSAVNGAQWNNTRTAVSAFIISAADANVQQAIRIEVTPISTADHPSLLLVCFGPEASNKSAMPISESGGNDWALQQLLQELNATREDFQRTIEQSRISNEEMASANEEIMAMNEELQSANEELESSKEELQSLNDELGTSNTNLDAKVVEVEALNADLGNLLNSTETATILLDAELCIRRFTSACARVMRIIPGDLGRAIDDVVRLIKDPDLSADCRQVIAGNMIDDREVQDQAGHWFLRRVLPYRDSAGRIAGAVLTFPDITSIKKTDQLLHERAKALQWQANLLSRAAPVVGRDLQDRVIFWNKGQKSCTAGQNRRRWGKSHMNY